jgi:single-strand selective monofunctional uracil DNA glycosylase
MKKRAQALRDAGRKHADTLNQLKFRSVPWVYNPLDYAWDAYQEYLERFVGKRTRVLFLGMNPGPWGMVQTGIPFGEVAAVKEFLQIRSSAKKPLKEHPKRPIDGLHCDKSEVSGRRLWGFFAKRFANAESFFQEHFVANYCALAFMEEGGKNVTPDKLSAKDREPLEAACDDHLRRMLEILEPDWLVGVGAFAEDCLRRCASNDQQQIGRILHPSPASPAANRDWEGTALKQLKEQAIWE